MRNCQGKFKQKVAFVDDEHIVLISKLSFANFPGGKFIKVNLLCTEHETMGFSLLFSSLLFSFLRFVSLLFLSFFFLLFFSFPFLSFLFFSFFSSLFLFLFFTFFSSLLSSSFSFLFPFFFSSFSPAQLTNSIEVLVVNTILTNNKTNNINY